MIAMQNNQWSVKNVLEWEAPCKSAPAEELPSLIEWNETLLPWRDKLKLQLRLKPMKNSDFDQNNKDKNSLHHTKFNVIFSYYIELKNEIEKRPRESLKNQSPSLDYVLLSLTIFITDRASLWTHFNFSSRTLTLSFSMSSCRVSSSVCRWKSWTRRKHKIRKDVQFDANNYTFIPPGIIISYECDVACSKS